MKKTVLAALLLVQLVGCSNGEPSVDAIGHVSATDSPDIAAPADAAPVECPPAFYSPLPDPAIVFGFPFQVARDRVYTTDAGEPRRGLTLEYLEGDGDAIWGDIVASLDAAGFKQANESTEALAGTFTKQGMPSIYVGLTPGPVENPTNPETKGSIWISWRRDQALREADPISEAP